MISSGPILRACQRAVYLGAGALTLTSMAASQSFNLDCGAAGQPVPASTYAGAAGQVGDWQSIEDDVALVDVDGNATSAQIVVPPQTVVTFDEMCTTGDDQSLMDDAHDPNNGTYRFSGLLPGDYTVYTYAMAPDAAIYVTGVSVPGSPDPLQTVGGDFCAGHQQGVTYARHSVSTANGAIFVEITVSSGFSSVNGFQIVRESGPTGQPNCPGDGTGTLCPCGNDGNSGEGCANSSGSGAVLDGSGVPEVANDTVVLTAFQAIPGQPGLFFQGINDINGGNGILFGDGLRCCGGNVVRLEVVLPNAAGDALTSVPIAATGGVSPGDSRCYQFWYRDPTGTPCGAGFNLTNSFDITWN